MNKKDTDRTDRLTRLPVRSGLAPPSRSSSTTLGWPRVDAARSGDQPDYGRGIIMVFTVTAFVPQ